MAWVLLDIALVVVALGVLAVVAVTVARQAVALRRELGATGGRVTGAANGLAAALRPLQDRPIANPGTRAGRPRR